MSKNMYKYLCVRKCNTYVLLILDIYIRYQLNRYLATNNFPLLIWKLQFINVGIIFILNSWKVVMLYRKRTILHKYHYHRNKNYQKVKLEVSYWLLIQLLIIYYSTYNMYNIICIFTYTAINKYINYFLLLILFDNCINQIVMQCQNYYIKVATSVAIYHIKNLRNLYWFFLM